MRIKQLAYAIGMIGFVGTANSVYAAEEVQKSEKIEVTGSRIMRAADTETQQPIVVVDRATIEKQGFSSVADILQNLPEAGSPAIARAEVLASGENVGGYYIDLRNLGANRTLVLLNGKRLGSTTDGLQDLGQIPVSAIQRIEVLKDGASAIYGSDAIAGVVNVITRNNFNGAEFNAQIGEYSQGDGQGKSFDITLGTSADRGSIMFSALYQKDDPVWARDRDFSSQPNGPRYPGTGTSPVSQNGSFEGPCGPNGATTWCTLKAGGDPTKLSDYRPHVAGDNANSNQQMMTQTGTERTSLMVSGKYEVTEWARFSTELLYNKRSTQATVAGYPYQSGSFDTPLSVDSYFNPLGNQHGYATPQDVEFRRRGWEKPRTTESQLETYRFGAGFDGDFSIGDKPWNWDVGFVSNRNDALKKANGDFNLINAGKALGPSFLDTDGKVKCGAAGAVIDGCVAWNPLLPFGVAGQGSLADSALQAYLFPEYHDTGRTKSTTYTINLAGVAATLPAGDLGVAVGLERRYEDGQFVPDAFNQSGLSSGLPQLTTKGKYDLKEAYLELDVPVLADLPFAKELTLNVASRYSDYSNFGDTTNSKLGLKWKPIKDLMVRGTYAEGFRAPSIGNLYGGTSGSFESYTDPCDVQSGNPTALANCQSGFGGQTPTSTTFRQIGQGGQICTAYPCQTPVSFTTGSNPKLTPETSESKTLGFAYSPSFVTGLNLTLDWYNIRIENLISDDTVEDILEDCYVRGIASRCTSFTRDAAGNIVAMNYGLTNKGWQETEGYDLGVSYRLPQATPIGKFGVRWNTSYVESIRTKSDNKPETPVSEDVSKPGNFRVRSNLGIDWDYAAFSATWGMRYFSAMRENCSAVAKAECNEPDYWAIDTGPSPKRRVGSNTFHDLQVRWTSPWKGTIAVGANNVFNHEGPIMYSAPSSQFKNYGGFDIGRYYYLKYKQRF